MLKLLLYVTLVQTAPDFNSIVMEVLALAGFAALVAVVINAGKYFGWIKDGDAVKWSGGLNLVGILALFITRLFLPDFNTAGINATLFTIATVASYILSYVMSLGISKLTHTVVTGIPVIGKSYTYDAAKAAAAALTTTVNIGYDEEPVLVTEDPTPTPAVPDPVVVDQPVITEEITPPVA